MSALLGLTAVDLETGQVTWAGPDATDQPCAADLPEGTPHWDPVLAAKGWIAVGGIWQRPDGGGDGEEAAA